MMQTILCTIAIALSLLSLQSSEHNADPWPAEPQSPLSRTDPYQYRLGLGVDVGATSEVILEPRVLHATGGDFIVDILTASNWTLANTEKITSSLRINGNPAPYTPSLKGKPGDEIYSFTIPIPPANISAVSVRVEWPVITFNSKVDEDKAALKTWPQEWPTSTQQYLQPSMFIESGSKRYIDFVQRTTEGMLRKVPPYYAAKDLVRAAIKEHRNVNPSYVYSENSGTVRGFDIRAIREIFPGRPYRTSQSPSATDLVCDCIAVLRTAGIPARPVIGIQSGNMIQLAPQIAPRRIRFVAWGEFYLPDSGWVPFDPNLMRGTSMSHLPVQKKWDFFGTIARLNRRAGIAYDFAPFSQGSVAGFPAGWSLRVSGQAFGPFEFVDATSPLMNASGPVQP